MRPYLQLIRLPNLFTAMADVAMGVLVVCSVVGWRGWATLTALMVAATCFYAGGVVLNDLFDRRVDVRQRPERPIPSGRVTPKVAGRLGWGLIGLAMALCGGTSASLYQGLPLLFGTVLAGCIIGYDLGLKRTPLGPLAMGACRTANIFLGMSVAGRESLTLGHLAIAGGIGLYIVGVTLLARTETARSNRWRLALATATMVLGVAWLGAFPAWLQIVPGALQRWLFLMTVLGLLTARRGLLAVADPSPTRVQSAVKTSILSLVVFDAAVCWAVRGPIWAVAVLALLIPAMVTGRWIRST